MDRKNMSPRQLKVLDACRNGWFMSGLYKAIFDGHEHSFWADSPRILFRDVDRWFGGHERHHAESHLLVKCVRAA